MADFELELKKLKLTIPMLAQPAGLYAPAVKVGNIVYTSGQLPLSEGRLLYKGRLGKEISLEKGEKAAVVCLANALAAVKWIANDLNRIKKIIRMNAFISSAIGFNDQSKVMNKASEILLQVFGDDVGAHSRVSVGCLELPMGACVELDLIVEVK